MSKTTPSLRSADAQLEKAIEGLDARHHTSFPDLFYDFLDLQLSFFCNNPDEHQQKLHQRTFSDPDRKAAFINAMKCYGEAAEGYHDPLGDLFMYRISHGQNGQFFTPEHVCDFMARIVDPMKESINDPTCGSGRLVLAGLKVARENETEPLIFANDLSITCSKMCLLNLLINCAGGEVTCGDGLRLDYENYRFFKMERLRPIFGGAALSTYWQYTLADVKQVEEQRREWWRARILEGWISANPIRESARETPKKEPEPQPTELKVDANGQLSLF